MSESSTEKTTRAALLLSGTKEELMGVRALKVLATAAAASLSVKRVEVADQDALCERTTPLAKSLVLTIGQATHIPSSNAMMRAVAALAPDRKLLGETDFQLALVDGWLEFIWCSIDIIVQDGDISSTLATFEKHLNNQTYLVGQRVTIADFSLASTFHFAKCDLSEYGNLTRFYERIYHLPAFQVALQAVASSTASPR